MPVYKYLFLFVLLFLFACDTLPGKKKKDAHQNKLPHYSLSNPGIYKMPRALDEISGICFGSNNSTMYAEEDEDGILYSFSLGSDSVKRVRFGKHGDYEDVQICRGFVVMLRSDGSLFSFSLAEAASDSEVTNTKEFKDILPKGEYEGMYADTASNQLYIICKKCKEDKDEINVGYILSLDGNGNIAMTGNFEVNTHKIAEAKGYKKIDFKPSAVTRSLAGEWFILSSVNKLLVVADADWKVKGVYPLDISIYNQPEGITFDAENNLYISNERGEEQNGTVCKLAYQK